MNQGLHLWSVHTEFREQRNNEIPSEKVLSMAFLVVSAHSLS